LRVGTEVDVKKFLGIKKTIGGSTIMGIILTRFDLAAKRPEGYPSGLYAIEPYPSTSLGADG
jgi:hypothetical protein